VERLLGDAKVLRVGSADELLDAYRRLVEIGGPLLVQEEIPGPDHNLHYYSGYHGQCGVRLGEFTFRKLRMLPIHAGAGTLIESTADPELSALSLQFALSLNYRGSLGLEFKLDPRDERLKLLDANARFGLWDGFAADCGVDLAYCAYRDAVGRPVSFNGAYRTGICSVDLRRDLEAAVKLYTRRELGPVAWLSSLLRVRSEVAFAWDDPAPFVHTCWLIARRVARGAARKVAGLRSGPHRLRGREWRDDG
jgi:predicted ATP-grasp superfamily ATP-dependent carboligase